MLSLMLALGLAASLPLAQTAPHSLNQGPLDATNMTTSGNATTMYYNETTHLFTHIHKEPPIPEGFPTPRIPIPVNATVRPKDFPEPDIPIPVSPTPSFPEVHIRRIPINETTAVPATLPSASPYPTALTHKSLTSGVNAETPTDAMKTEDEGEEEEEEEGEEVDAEEAVWCILFPLCFRRRGAVIPTRGSLDGITGANHGPPTHGPVPVLPKEGEGTLAPRAVLPVPAPVPKPRFPLPDPLPTTTSTPSASPTPSDIGLDSPSSSANKEQDLKPPYSWCQLKHWDIRRCDLGDGQFLDGWPGWEHLDGNGGDDVKGQSRPSSEPCSNTLVTSLIQH